MAYNLSERFLPPPKYFYLLEPGAYQFSQNQVQPNKAPFLSTTPRNATLYGNLWTHAIYDPCVSSNIPNITSINSKCPRFLHEELKREDIEALLCRCGIENSCECPTEEEENEETIDKSCQAKVKRRIFKGLTLPVKQDYGFNTIFNQKEYKNDYCARGKESTDFYRGCKWSKWTSKRAFMSPKSGPGPADYCFSKQPTDFEICAEKFKEFRRMTSKQLRFIEIIQQRNILNKYPGPSTYNPELPKSYKVSFMGPKAQRFLTNKIEKRPGPADYWVKRSFEPPDSPEYYCQAKLPKPSFFGVKDLRFKPRREEGPSPASYDPAYKPCDLVHSCAPPFGSSSVRFKGQPSEVTEKELLPEYDTEKDLAVTDKVPCACPSWEFKSKTIRFHPLRKILNQPSPADLPLSRVKMSRRKELQYLAPFFSSEGRFRPWYDWMPVFAKEKTPGPCSYSLEMSKCYSPLTHHPIYRAPRFTSMQNENPAPNEYNVGGGVETILVTHNQHLKDNIKKQHTFKWKAPVHQTLNFEEQESLLLNKSIELLNCRL